MVIHSDKSSDNKELESSPERILPSQHEFFKDSLEEIAPVRRNMDADTLQWMREGIDREIRKTEN